MFDRKFLQEADGEVYQAICQEEGRQRNKLEMIASENFASRAVMAAQGSVLTNKYAEGYPGKRYYGGCEFVDIVEDIARDRACALFNSPHVNVQPHSGAQANMAAYYVLLESGDRVLGMSLAHGGHLTHGSPVNFSGRNYQFYSYGVDEDTEVIDYDEVRMLAKQAQPKLIVAGASAYPRIIDFAALSDIAKEVDAKLMVDMAHIAGLVAAGEHPSPIPYCDIVTTTTHKTLRGPRGGAIFCGEEYAKAVDKAVFPGIQGGPLMHVIAAKAVAFGEASTPEFVVYQKQIRKNAKVLSEELLEKGFRLVSGGTDNHLMLVDVRNRHLTGKEAEKKLDAIGITVNKNAIPFDPQSPFITSGIRVGTKEAEMKTIAQIYDFALSDNEDYTVKAASMVKELAEAFPLYE